MNTIKIKGRKLYNGTQVIGEITGWRQMTAKWGVTGPGYGFTLINGRECEPCYAYFDEAVRAAKYEAGKVVAIEFGLFDANGRFSSFAEPTSPGK